MVYMTFLLNFACSYVPLGLFQTMDFSLLRQYVSEDARQSEDDVVTDDQIR